MRKASFVAIALTVAAATVALSTAADARCRNCVIGGVIYAGTPAGFYTLYGPPNPDRWVRSPYNWTGPNTLRRSYVRYYR